MPHTCRWHAGCFKCGSCQKLIGQGTVWTEPSHPGIPYCSNVCLAAVHNPCTVCGKPLTGMVGFLALCDLVISNLQHALCSSTVTYPAAVRLSDAHSEVLHSPREHVTSKAIPQCV